MNNIKNNQKTLLEQIKINHKNSFYKNEEIPKLIAVSKQQNYNKVLEALEVGQRFFGENKVQEAEKRWFNLLNDFDNIELHMIGPLQSNKVKNALKIFDYIHTLDRESLAYEISKHFNQQSKTKEFFIQINTGLEKQKSGIEPKNIENFLNLCIKKLNLPVTGLMCIPPIKDDAAIHFCFLKKLSIQYKLKNLSMGMSSDFEEAIKFGANHLRIGSNFFGKRDNYKK